MVHCGVLMYTPFYIQRCVNVNTGVSVIHNGVLMWLTTHYWCINVKMWGS